MHRYWKGQQYSIQPGNLAELLCPSFQLRLLLFYNNGNRKISISSLTFATVRLYICSRGKGFFYFPNTLFFSYCTAWFPSYTYMYTGFLIEFCFNLVEHLFCWLLFIPVPSSVTWLFKPASYYFLLDFSSFLISVQEASVL